VNVHDACPELMFSAAKALSDALTVSMSLPGLTGQSSTPGRCLLDRPVEPGDDSEGVSTYV
jgi:hypothetical protein